MKTLFATLAAATAVAALAAPAAAQPGYDRHDDHGRYEQRHDNRWDNDRGGYNINARQAQLQQRIEWGVRRGMLDRREATRLRDESRDIARLEARYRIGGLSWNERADLDRRLDRLDTRIARETHDRDYGRR